MKKKLKMKKMSNGCVHILSHKIGNHGYTLLTRKLDNVQYYTAHRYMFALNKKHPGDMCVCHKCDNRRCVNHEHMFLGTRADNMHDCHAKGRYSKAPRLIGEDNHQSKLNISKVANILRLKGIISQRALAKKYGVTQTTISNIHLRKVWNHVGGI